MGFSNDYSQAQQPNGLKPEGDYEVLISKIEEQQTKSSGKIYLSMSMVIRNDVEQKYKNGFIFHAIWKRKEPSPADLQVKGYSFGQIMALAKAANLPDGKNYADLAELLTDMKDKPVLVRLKHGEYKGEKREEVNFFAPTKYPEVRHIMKKKPDITPDTYAAPQAAYSAQPSFAAAAQMPNLSDEDLPF